MILLPVQVKKEPKRKKINERNLMTRNQKNQMRKYLLLNLILEKYLKRKNFYLMKLKNHSKYILEKTKSIFIVR